MSGDRYTKAVDAIVNDLLDRKGLSDEWDQIDEDIQEEIKKMWAHLIWVAINE